jgi:hypothetical protein
MSYRLSFAEDFFMGTPDGEIGSDDLRKLYPVSPLPQNVMQALISMEIYEPGEFKRMVKEVLGYSLVKGQPADETVFHELMKKVRSYSTCDTLESPINVYVSDNYWVTVYEDTEEEVA